MYLNFRMSGRDFETTSRYKHQNKNVYAANLVLQKLASQGGDLADAIPSLSILSKIILLCPLGTASVERSFSTMVRICNRLGQRMLAENLALCMRISAEGPNTLTAEQSEKIVRKWHSRHDDRRIRK